MANTNVKKMAKAPALPITLRSALMLAAVFAGGFLMGRVHIGDNLWPFGTAYVLAAFVNPRAANPYAALAGVFAALAANIPLMADAPFNLTVVALSTVLMIAVTILRLPMRPVLGMAAAAVSYIVCTLAFKRHLLLSLLPSLAELLICAVVILVVSVVVELAREGAARRVLSDEELICIAFFGVLLILGIGDINLFGIYPRGIAASFLAVVAAYLGGAGVGAAVAAAAGFGAALGGADISYIAILAISAATAGMMRKMHKGGVALGFMISCAIMTVYARAAELSALIPLVESAVASLALLFMPRRALAFLGSYVDANLLRLREQGIQMAQFRRAAVGRLREVADVFGSAAETMLRYAQRDGSESISYMISEIPENACAKCMFFKSCWDDDFANTYTHMKRMYAKYARRGTLKEQDLGAAFARKCISPGAVCAECNRVFERYSANRRFEEKLLESRELVGRQLAGVARIMRNMSETVQEDMQLRPETEEAVRLALDAAGIAVRDVSAETCGGQLFVELTLKSCGGAGACRKRIAPILSRACGVPMECPPPEGRCGMAKLCTLRYAQALAWTISCAVAAEPRVGSNVSGDCHAIVPLRDGRQMLLLCDGMGSGEKAAGESAAAANLVEEFYRAGFDEDTILESINKLLILSSADETFSTLDLAMIDRATGTVKFTKVGAAHSYIVSAQGNISRLDAGSLPIGILDEFHPVVHEARLADGDMILMMTDGVADVAEEMLEDISAACRRGSSREAADSILSAAIARQGGAPQDDMTVLAARLRAAEK